MRFTRRLTDRRSSHAFFIVSSALIAGAAWSCGSDDAVVPSPEPSPDASHEQPPPSDASVEDDVVVRPEAGLTHAGPLPVVCDSGPCAVSLVTSSSGDSSRLDEGFCTLMKDGTVVCWGSNVSGQLGRGEDAGNADSAVPARVVGLSKIVSLHHTCAVDEDGAAFCWGTGPFGENGTAITTERAPLQLPIPPASHVDATRTTACAVTGATVRCWGANEDGQVGPFSTTPRKVMHEPTIVPLSVAGTIRDIAMGRATLVLHDDGTIESWGANPPLGRSSPLFPDPYPQRLAFTGITSLDLIYDNACVTAGGIGYCWGSVLPNFSERETSAVDLSDALPEAIATPEPIVQVATTINVVRYDRGTPITQRRRWCAIGVSGDVYCSGANASGQAGDGTKDHAYEPVKVAGLPSPAAQVRALPDSTCALLTNGKVYCWGSNYYGQLGNRDMRRPSLTPQEVVMP